MPCFVQLPQWIPVSIVKGSRPTNLLVGLLESDWGKKLFGKTLVRSIAEPVWKVCVHAMRACQGHALTGYSFGLMCRDRMQNACTIRSVWFHNKCIAFTS